VDHARRHAQAILRWPCPGTPDASCSTGSTSEIQLLFERAGTDVTDQGPIGVNAGIASRRNAITSPFRLCGGDSVSRRGARLHARASPFLISRNRYYSATISCAICVTRSNPDRLACDPDRIGDAGLDFRMCRPATLSKTRRKLLLMHRKRSRSNSGVSRWLAPASAPVEP
jgi:hypothetical protein